ncbi:MULTISPECIES: hypothetical protein [Brevibacillus]|nr:MULTISPECIES: hypothetical protein [Brevibacillus]MCM3081770.1 hypothetical protein [Brevibacillus invocatus]MCM3432177.1 hypothetical protein [Brevibacillus invocatus]MDH4619799.1 hypothetical protein [Brevibacillus sp. AY1]
MTKLLSILMCIVFSLGIIVSSVSEVNRSVVKDGGLRDRAVSWIDQAIP